MLQLKNIRKEYHTGDLIQVALDDVSLNLRDNEFVAILGPSGSGKTTLLNIIGGLDRYDSGDLIINDTSTKKYSDRDWDSYRNHTIGFVFQSYNLIPHQSVLSNVELALTISGISSSERKKRAIEALEKVGLGNQVHKRPNQMSGGQMQRVAIARALVNDPEILLADEPTGALDTETSVQVMDLLKSVAEDRLVVMVTHNPELAKEYATRIVRVKDGKIIDDSRPLDVSTEKLSVPVHRNLGKASMSFFTALSLSFNNLRTKKGRTFLTAFAGSIGIIGIALILSLSTGVNSYITDIQKSTMSSYPISIESQTIDFSKIEKQGGTGKEDSEVVHDLDAVYSDGSDIERQASMTASITENNLTAFKKYLEDENSRIYQYVGENGIVYGYDTKFNIYSYDADEALVNADGSTLTGKKSPSANGMASMMSTMMGSFPGGYGDDTIFSQLIPDSSDPNQVSKVVQDHYEVVYGNWPTSYDEVVLVLDENNKISATALYKLGLLPTMEYRDYMQQISDGEEIEFHNKSVSYEDVCNQTLYFVPQCDYFEKDEYGKYADISENESKVKELVDRAVQLKITAVVRPKEEDTNVTIDSSIGYLKSLTDYIIEYTDQSEVVQAQKENPEVSVLNSMTFEPADDQQKIEDAATYLSELSVSDKAEMCRTIMQSQMVTGAKEEGADTSSSSDSIPEDSALPSERLTGMDDMNDTSLAAMLDRYLEHPEDEVLLSIYEAYVSPGSYEDNMESFGVISLDAPSSIDIYADSFEDKDEISKCIDEYNKNAGDEEQITFTDYVGMLMSSITTIINVISYVLIAFVAVSLVVSSIMIGIITYISVLERTKEIGILRAMGASKHNVSQVFNAETFIIGLFSGVLGIGITLLLLIPGNSIIHVLTGSESVNAALPASSAVILIVLSTILTLIGGFIPSKKAAKKDPVTALRTE